MSGAAGDRTTDPTRVEEPLTSALAQTTFVLVTILGRLGAEHDLSLTQMRVLGILRDRRRVRVSGLATHLGLERSTLTGLVDRAVRRDLLARQPSPEDGRAVDVSLTPAGQELADRLYRAFATEVDRLAAGLTAAERARFAALSRRLLEATDGVAG